MALPRRSLVLVATAAAAVACGDGPTEPAAGAPAFVIIERSPGLLDVGDTVRLGARAYDADGRLVPRGAPVTWRALDTAVAHVDDVGLVTGWEGGTARVVATAGTAADTATLVVEVRVRSVELTVTNVSFRPDSANYVGNTLSLSATARDGRGRTLTTAPFTFGVADTTVASAPVVSPPGSLTARSTARRAGTALFSAEVNGVRGERSVEIRAAASANVVASRRGP